MAWNEPIKVPARDRPNVPPHRSSRSQKGCIGQFLDHQGQSVSTYALSVTLVHCNSLLIREVGVNELLIQETAGTSDLEY